MSDPLSGTLAKLERAQEHLEDLDQRVSRFLMRNPYGISSELDNEGEEFRAHVWETLPTTPWAILIGECLHNLRTALDHLAWQLSIRHSGSAPDKTEFPIFQDGPAFNRRTKKGDPAQGSGLYKIRGVHPDAQTIIERLQPYNAGDNAEKHLLWVLQKLSNIDKHQVLHLAGAVAAESTYSLTGPVSGSFRDEFRFGPFEDGAVVARFWFSPEMNPGVRVELELRLHIAFLESAARGLPIVPVLRETRTLIVRDVLPPLSSFLN